MYAPVHARIHAQEQHRNEIKGPTTLRVRTFTIRLKSEKNKNKPTTSTGRASAAASFIPCLSAAQGFSSLEIRASQPPGAYAWLGGGGMLSLQRCSRFRLLRPL